jgi:thiol-disulfide isomerase/thioredoxin
MRKNFLLLLLFCIDGSVYGQVANSTSVNIGDPAPTLHIREWIKGKAVGKFENNMTYVVEFWATWCAPCKAAMPRLSKLARKYKNKARFIGIDVYEQQVPIADRKKIDQIKAFVDSMGRRMNYTVGIGDSNFMEKNWLAASGYRGIPNTFVINSDGKVAWVGHPMYLREILPKILYNSWDINAEIAKHNSDKELEKLDDSLSSKLIPFNGDPKISGDFGKPDSALLVINELVRSEPKLKYAPNMALYTFSALLKTDQHKAYGYGKQLLMTSKNDERAFNGIIYIVEWWSDKITINSEIYQLCAEAYQAKIDNIPYPEITDMAKIYNKMAAWYWRANNKSKAIYGEKKAIKAMKRKSD